VLPGCADALLPDPFARPVAAAPPAPLAERDRLWCRAILDTLPLEQVNAVLVRFNGLRREAGAP
jgi:hypothetical protein